MSCRRPDPVDGDRWDWRRETYPEPFLLCNRHVVELQVCSLPSPNRHRAQPWLKAGVRAGNRPSHMFIQPWPPHGPAIVQLSGTEWACRGVRASRMTSAAGGMRGQTGCFISALPDIHGALFRSDSSGLLLPDWPKGKIPAPSLIRYRKRHKAVVVARLRVQGPRTFRSWHTKHLKCNNEVGHEELKAWCQLARVMGIQPKEHQNQYIQRLLALDGKCTQVFQPNTHPQTHTLGFGGGVLLFFSLWPLVGESVPVARLAWGTVLCLAPGDTCMAANWAAYNCCSETERDRKRKRERRDRRDRRVDEEERKVHE